MWRTNVAVALVVAGTLTVYTAVANLIPQVESEVPTELELAAGFSTEELVSAGEQIFHGAGGCTACHGLGTRAPNLLGVAGRTCAERQPGRTCKAYLYESLTEPGAFVVEGFQPIMPDMRRNLSRQQIWATVAFLESQGGEVTVTAADVGGGQRAEGSDPGSDAVPGPAPSGGTGALFGADASDPAGLLQQAGCTACHLLDGVGGPVGPPFDDMGALDSDYIRRSILDPAADTASGYEALGGTMPSSFGDRLSAAQLEAIVNFLARRR